LVFHACHCILLEKQKIKKKLQNEHKRIDKATYQPNKQPFQACEKEQTNTKSTCKQYCFVIPI